MLDELIGEPEELNISPPLKEIIHDELSKPWLNLKSLNDRLKPFGFCATVDVHDEITIHAGIEENK